MDLAAETGIEIVIVIATETEIVVGVIGIVTVTVSTETIEVDATMIIDGTSKVTTDDQRCSMRSLTEKR